MGFPLGVIREYEQKWGVHDEKAHHKTTGDSTDYAVLGIDENADLATVKKAYRLKMKALHPDKLAATGKSEKALEAAAIELAQVQAAYERLKQK